jgi:putative hemolysin
MEPDTSGIWVEFGLIVLLLVISGFLAASEIAVISVKKSNIKQLADNGHRRAGVVLKLLEQPGRFIATSKFGITLAGFLACTMTVLLLGNLFSGQIDGASKAGLVDIYGGFAIFFIVLLMTYVFLVFGELVPKRVALTRSEEVTIRVANLINFFVKLFTPFVWVLDVSTNIIIKPFGVKGKESGTQVTEEEIRLMLDVGEEEGLFREAGKDMINSIFEFDDTILREVMTPRTEIVAIDVDADIAEIAEQARYSRIPVYREDLDDIIGIFYVKDLMPFLCGKPAEDFSVLSLMREPVLVPDTKKTDELFREMQQKKIHMAIVIDEYGGTAGLVTIEDLLEEIVGNIFDEYDEEEIDYECVDENTYTVNGRLSIEEVNELLHSQLPEEDDYETIAGFVIGLLGHIPAGGEEVEFADMTFTVGEVEERRIETIIIRKNPAQAEA